MCYHECFVQNLGNGFLYFRRMSAGRLLQSHYRSFLRLASKFREDQIPLARISRYEVDTPQIDALRSVSLAFRSQQAIKPTAASAALARLNQQFNVLLNAEDDTREVVGIPEMFHFHRCTAGCKYTFLMRCRRSDLLLCSFRLLGLGKLY